MTRPLLLLAAFAVPLVLAGCSGDSDSIGVRGPTYIGPLPDDTIDIDGKTYVLKRGQYRYSDGEEREGWSIVVDGTRVRCQAPSRAGCEGALINYERQKSGGGGMY